MNISIIGLGLLGGSFGLALRKLDSEFSITGVDTNEQHSKLALELGIVDQISPFNSAIENADLIILATPVDVIVEQIIPCLDQLNSEALLIDLGSTKIPVCEKVESHKNRGRFVPAHPIAGTEDSGPKAAFSELLPNKMMIVCDTEKSDDDALKKAVHIFQKIGMQVEYMSSRAHDMHIAYVSHLSHISSFALGSSVLDKEKDENNIFIMAGSGFGSTVRLAKSSPEMWTPIFSQNRKNISVAIGSYIEKLQSFKEMLDNDDREAMHNFMKEVNDIRRVLKGN